MSIISVINAAVLGPNPADLNCPFEFEITFECLEPLDEDLEFKVIYVGCPEDKMFDQELDSVLLGPVARGRMKFVISSEPPDVSKIPPDDLEGFTVVMLTGKFKNQEFIRIGWYVQNLLADTGMHRVVLSDAPRVTRFNISWT